MIVGEVASYVHQNLLFFFFLDTNVITFPSLVSSEGWSYDSSVRWCVGRSGGVCSRTSSLKASLTCSSSSAAVSWVFDVHRTLRMTLKTGIPHPGSLETR